MSRPLDPEQPSETLGLGHALVAAIALVTIAGTTAAVTWAVYNFVAREAQR